jgi:hypothetical protein
MLDLARRARRPASCSPQHPRRRPTSTGGHDLPAYVRAEDPPHPLVPHRPQRRLASPTERRDEWDGDNSASKSSIWKGDSSGLEAAGDTPASLACARDRPFWPLLLCAVRRSLRRVNGVARPAGRALRGGLMQGRRIGRPLAAAPLRPEASPSAVARTAPCRPSRPAAWRRGA